MTKFHKYLNEKLIEVDQKDIDLLFKPLEPYSDIFTKLIDVMIKNGPMSKKEIINEFYKNNLDFIPSLLEKVSSEDLVSENAKIAHEIKPMTIKIYNMTKANLYEPTINIIKLGFVTDHVNILFDFDRLHSREYKRFKNEFSKNRMKTTIRHELTHWIDDTLHNFYISNLVNKVRGLGKEGREIFLQGKDIVNLTDREINAIVNQLDQLKKELGKKIWDQLTWDDLETLVSSAYSKNFSSNIGYEFRKLLKKRMSRENILGKNMR